ncbi:MAG: glycosyltransferase family 39 protein [Nibricoccus sp.]
MDLARAIWSGGHAPLLVENDCGEWIEANSRYVVGTLPVEEKKIYQRRFEIAEMPKDAVFALRGYSDAKAYLDDALILQNNPDQWRRKVECNIANKLTPGSHTLTVVVSNRLAPAIIQTSSSVAALNTDESWLFSFDGKDWFLTAKIGHKEPPDASLAFHSPWVALLKWLPSGAALTGGVILLYIAIRTRFRDAIHANLAVITKWCVLAAWVALAWNNIPKVPLIVGHDIKDHLDYITHIIQQHRIPLAKDGWQMFQPPLYYLVSAAWFTFTTFFTASSGVLLTSLRFIPFICGAVQVELSFRAIKNVIPDKPLTQSLGILIAGLLPMNLYMAQVVGNEPMAGMLISIGITYALYLVQKQKIPSKSDALLLGLLIGFGLLTKLTAFLLIPIATAALLWADDHTRSWRKIGTNFSIMATAIAAICGWYYVRNWLLQGSLFSYGSWELGGSQAWWQNPGYRLPSDFIAFGASLTRPIYSSTNGFWDSLYSTFWLDASLSGILDFSSKPPWNFNAMLACALLALLPTSLMIVGFCRGFTAKANLGVMLCTFAVSVYLIALLSIFLKVPIYSTAKASYALGATPCFAVLFAAGFETMPETRWLRTTVAVIVVFWAITAYSSYFVL